MRIRNKDDLRIAVENARPHYPKEVARLELYRLACYFLASKSLRDLSDGGDDCPFQSLRDDFEQSEIARILILLGSAGRLICDQVKNLGHERILKENLVGRVHDDVTKGHARDLNVSEVCSKLLHAKLIIPKIRYQGNPYRRYLHPHVTLYSDTSRDIGWRADVSIEKLVSAFSKIMA